MAFGICYFMCECFAHFLHFCVSMYKLYLLQYGGDLAAKDGDGYTPLSVLNEDRERFKSSLGK